MPAAPTADVDAYVAAFPPPVQAVLHELRHRIREVLPGAAETISYQMPAFAVDGRPLVWFAGWKHHVSVYPVPDVAADEALARDLEPFRAGKGTVRFPLAQPLPFDLVARLVATLAAQRTEA